MQLLRAGIGARAQPLDQHAQADERQDHRQRTEPANEPTGPCLPRRRPSAAGPAKPCSGRASPRPARRSRRGPRARSRRCRSRGTGRGPTSPRSAAASRPPVGEPIQSRKTGTAQKQGAQDEGHRHVRRQERGDHPDRDQHDPHQPVAEVGREHHPEVGISPGTAAPAGGSARTRGPPCRFPAPRGTCPARRRRRARAG